MSQTPLLSTHQLSLKAGTKTLCKNIDWQIHSGEKWAILGLNGAGKTTLLHTLAGLRKTDRGEVRLSGKNIKQWNRREIAQRVGLLLQENYDPFPGQVLDYVMIGRHPHLKSWQWESSDDLAIANTAMKLVDLSGYEMRDIATLSGGERQRMAIAAVLAQQPKLFLLDEPVNHLDWHHQHSLLQVFTGLITSQNKTMVMAIHDVNLAARYCDHILMIFDNGIVKSGTVDEMLQPDNLSILYGHEVKRIKTDSAVLFMPA